MEKKNDKRELNNDDFKPRKWLLYLLIFINIVIVVILINKVITDRKNSIKDNHDNGIVDFFENLNDLVENDDQFSDFEINSFNASFEMYVGTEYGLQLSNLIDEIITNNKTNQDKIITVVFGNVNTTDVDEIRKIKKSLDDWTKYEVILDYDDNGFVNLITIEK